MTTVYEIAKIEDTTPTTVDVYRFDQTDLVLVDTKISSNGLARVAEYVVAAGDASKEARVFVNISTSPTANGGFGSTRYAITVNSRMTRSDDGELVWDYPVQGTISFTIPGTGVHDAAQVSALVENIVSLAFDSVTSQAHDTGHISKLAYRAPALY